MKLFVIGAGSVGSHIASTAAILEPFSQIVVGDLNAQRAAAVAAIAGGSSVRLDATDHDALVAAMRSADVVVSAIGPATRFGLSTLRAAIAAGRPYAEISDDPYPTLEMLKLNAAAQAAGVTAILGLGASPGIASMLAVDAGSRLDEVNRILTGWGTGGSDEDSDDNEFSLNVEVSAALEHWVEQASGTIPVLRGGEIVETAPLARVTVDYPGIGQVVTRTIGHPEPITLKRRFPELRESLNVMDFPSFIFRSLEKAAKTVDQSGSTRKGAELLLELFSGDTKGGLFSRKSMSYVWHETLDKLSRKHWLPPLWAIAEGSAGGRPARVAASLSGVIRGGTGRLTGVPAAVAVSMLATGDVACGSGVHTIETALTPDRFFSKLAPFIEGANGKPPAQATTVVMA